MIRINCDIGERGSDNPVDQELMRYINIANIACGGHAGDEVSVKAFAEMADYNGVMTCAHLSYPDRENFGRKSMDMDPRELLASLDKQFSLLPDTRMVKFHGALYNDSCVNAELASVLTSWLSQKSLDAVLTPFDSVLAEDCRKKGITVLPEAFAERRYQLLHESGRLVLVSRTKDYASIHDCDSAEKQAINIATERRVLAVVEEEGENMKYRWVPILAETICIHSDSPISLELAKRLSEKECM
jgi:UPF0271 protein